MARSRWTEINRARARRAPGSAKVSKAERAYGQRLEVLRLAGEVLGWQHAPISLRLASGCFYHPDYLVIAPDLTVELHEVKGASGWDLDDEGRTKWKAAGERFPFFRFVGALRTEHGGWKLEAYEPVEPWPGPGPGGEA